MPAYEPFENRFWKNVQKNTNDQCWLWSGCFGDDGYGRLRAERGYLTKHGKRFMWATHRASWTLHFGEIPDGLSVLHRCDVKACVNPEHLFLGTQADNMADKTNKGRAQHGEAHGMSKLTESNVRAIRQMKNLAVCQNDIAEFFGVSKQLVSLIVRRRLWKSLENV